MSFSVLPISIYSPGRRYHRSLHGAFREGSIRYSLTLSMQEVASQRVHEWEIYVNLLSKMQFFCEIPWFTKTNRYLLNKKSFLFQNRISPISNLKLRKTKTHFPRVCIVGSGGREGSIRYSLTLSMQEVASQRVSWSIVCINFQTPSGRSGKHTHRLV